MIRCAIVDDEEPARALMQNFAERSGLLKLEGCYGSVLELGSVISRNKLDLVFMDIQMPDVKGIDFVKSLKNGPRVIFTTAYTDYAVQAFELEALDYLVKPFSFERFLQAVYKLNRKGLNYQFKQSKEQILNIKADHRIYRISTEDIQYIEGLKEYVSLFTLCRVNASLRFRA